MTRLVRSLACASVFMLLSAGSAEAAPTADQSAAAEDLFQRAKVLFAKRDFASACPMFLESYRLDPAGGTLQNLALCYEASGKWASAYARFQELRAVSKSGDRPRPDRVRLADEHIAKLAPRISRIVVILPQEIATKDAEVVLDGVTYLHASWSTGILVDPGPHELVVTAPGKQAFRTTVNTPTEGAQEEVRVPTLTDVVKPSAPVEATSPPSPSPGTVEVRKPAGALPVAGLVSGGVGAAALVAGGIFGILTFAKDAEATDACTAAKSSRANSGDFDPTERCYADSESFRQANELKDSARSLANVSNVLVGVGVVGLGLGAFFVLQGRSSSKATASNVTLTPGLGGAALQGTF